MANYCVDCLNRKRCNKFTGDVMKKACGGFVFDKKDQEGYNDFCDNETHIRKPGGVEIVNGKELPYEYWDIGMVRNAKAENKKETKVYLEPTPNIVLDQNIPLRGWYKGKFESPRVRNRPCFCEAMLTQPYGGSCPVRCRMCYVGNGGKGWRNTGCTVVDPSYPDKIATQLDKMKYAWGGYISSFTEPFQPVEEIYHNTQRTAEAFVSRGLPIFFLTRQIPPSWADDLLLKSKYSYQQYSIMTSNKDDFKKFSPGVADYDSLLKNIEKQRKMGIYISIQINPIIAGIVSNKDIVKLLEDLSSAGANHVIFKFVEIVSPAVKALVRETYKLFPEKAHLFEQLFTDTIGGMRTIREDYRIASLQLYMREATRLGLSMGLCYEYCYERNSDNSIKNKTGVSLGKQFCSSPNGCHGQYFPLHIKNETTGMFEPFTKCPPIGCLHCSDVYPDNPPCGSKFLQEARALQPNHYNIRISELDKKFLPIKDPEEIVMISLGLEDKEEK